MHESWTQLALYTGSDSVLNRLPSATMLYSVTLWTGVLIATTGERDKHLPDPAVIIDLNNGKTLRTIPIIAWLHIDPSLVKPSGISEKLCHTC